MEDRKFARREEYDALHEKVDNLAEGQSEIKGILKGMKDQKGSDITFFGMLAAIMLGLWNMVK